MKTWIHIGECNNPTKSLDYLGFNIDHEKYRFFLKHNRAIRYYTVAIEFLNYYRITAKRFASFLGCVTFCLPCIENLLLHLKSSSMLLRMHCRLFLKNTGRSMAPKPEYAQSIDMFTDASQVGMEYRAACY
uniref:Transposase n=1 Tax=Strongyloides venezuelensis TaxID=75913 RepID=A0A0K0FD02_STRVS